MGDNSASLDMVLDCVPTAQERPRFMHSPAGFAMAYKSRRQKRHEAELEAQLARYRPEKPFKGPLSLRFLAVFSVPKTRSRKQREAMLRGDICRTSKPDLDNLAKNLKDAMTRQGFWHDDSQIVALLGFKLYTPGRGQWDVSVSGNDGRQAKGEA